jgi:DNA adenine methylase
LLLQKNYYNSLVLSIGQSKGSNESNSSTSDTEVAALYITLNKTCANGLYRVNEKGVPIGDYKNPNICDSSNLKNVSDALRYFRPIISAGDFVCKVVEDAQKGDFVYLDPPYDPISKTSHFTSYTLNGFSDNDQVQLASVYRKLSDKGCFALLSNSDTPFIRGLYPGFTIRQVGAQRAINFKGSKRTGHKELLISNYSGIPNLAQEMKR